AIMTYIDGQSTSGPLVTFHTADDENAILEGFTVRNAPNGAGISANGSSPTILSCKIVGNIGNTGSNGGGFHCQDANILIDECEIKNNVASDGGGLWMSGGSLTMSNTLLRGNSTSGGGLGGGGIYATGTSLGIAWCDFEDNVATGYDARGGAISMYANATLSMANTNLVNNTSNMHHVSENTNSTYYARGGAIYATSCTGMITNCDFSGNQAYVYLDDTNGSAGGDQGGIGIAQGGDLALFDFTNIQTHNCNHLDANAYAYGSGGVCGGGGDYVEPIAKGGSTYLHGSAIFMTNALISNCSATHTANDNTDGTPRGDGGALYSDSNGNPFLTNCQLVGCSASYNGGAIYTRDTASPFMLNGHISSNTAAHYGGGMYSENSTPVVTGAVIANNVALAGGGIYSQGGAPNLPTVSETLFCGNAEGHVTGAWYDDGGNTFSELCGDDCNNNGLPDEYDILFGYSLDCNENGVPDECDIANGGDCDGNGIPDECDIADGLYEDCDGNGVPDTCEMAMGDCNDNGILDACEEIDDCNGNGIPDSCDLAEGTSIDCDGNGIPDECEPDCNQNGIVDACDVSDGTSTDCNENGIPDECDVIFDCNDNGVSDACEIANGDAEDNNGNWIPDECECPADANGDGFVNVNDLLEIVGTWGECAGCGGDIDGDGFVNVNDLLAAIDAWGACP
ncbi:MAG: hypothetical protein H8E83_00160, partial [Planctomycetes bacterium]|nr:hypothetical protein [Planctomycetota bacterium]